MCVCVQVYVLSSSVSLHRRVVSLIANMYSLIVFFLVIVNERGLAVILVH